MKWKDTMRKYIKKHLHTGTIDNRYPTTFVQAIYLSGIKTFPLCLMANYISNFHTIHVE